MARLSQCSPKIHKGFTKGLVLLWLFVLHLSIDLHAKNCLAQISVTQISKDQRFNNTLLPYNSKLIKQNNQTITNVTAESSSNDTLSPVEILARDSEASGIWDGPGDGLDNIRKLTSCQGRCGDRTSFPCSCSDVCVLQGNCCHDMATECGDEFESGRNKFEHLLAAEVECSSLTNTFMVMSCPDSRGSSDGRGVFLQSVKEISSRSSSVGAIKLEVTSTAKTVTLPVDLSTRSFDTENFVNILEDSTPRQVSDAQGETNQPASALLSLMLNSPVTDATSGVVYKNQSIARCNNVPDQDIRRWGARIEVVSLLENPISLVVLEKIISVKDFEYQAPLLPNKARLGNRCIRPSKRTCQDRWLEDRPELEAKCHKGGIAYVADSFNLGSRTVFDNIFCFICYFGSANFSEVIFEHDPTKKTFKLSLVASLTGYETLSLKANIGKDFFLWNSVECIISSAQQDGGVCQAKECGMQFQTRPDGQCRTHYQVFLAIGRKNCPYMISKKLETRFLSIIKCYLGTFVNAEVGENSLQFNTIYDERLATPLIQTKLTVYFPSRGLKDSINQIMRDLQILLYNANFCCDPSPPAYACKGKSCLSENSEVPFVRTLEEGYDLITSLHNRNKSETYNSSFPIMCTQVFRESVEPDNFECLDRPISFSELRDFYHQTSNATCFGKENRKFDFLEQPQLDMCNRGCKVMLEKCYTAPLVVLIWGLFKGGFELLE